MTHTHDVPTTTLMMRSIIRRWEKKGLSPEGVARTLMKPETRQGSSKQCHVAAAASRCWTNY
jgi:hypothetical protein